MNAERRKCTYITDNRNCVERWNTRVRSLCLLYNSSFFVFFVCISPTKYVDCYVSKSKTFKVTEKKLRSVTINQKLEKKTFALKRTLFCNIQGLPKGWKMQSFTFSFVCITSSKLITVSCISKVLSLMWITGQPLKIFSRHCKSKTEIFWSMQWVYMQKLPELIKYQSCKSAN